MKQTDKNIKEIRIYHSLWKNILLTVGCFAFAAGGYFILHDANTSWPTKVFGGIGSMVFFSCDGYLPYEQRKRTYRTIYFKDVEQFRLISIYSNNYIAIDYCAIPLMRKMENASCLTQRMMEFNVSVSGAIESILVQNLSTRGK